MGPTLDFPSVTRVCVPFVTKKQLWIKSKTGELVIDPKSINDRFREYYAELYFSKAKGNVSDWLGCLRLPKLSEAA